MFGFAYAHFKLIGVAQGPAINRFTRLASEYACQFDGAGYSNAGAFIASNWARGRGHCCRKITVANGEPNNKRLFSSTKRCRRPTFILNGQLPGREAVNDGQKARKDDGGAHFSRVRPSTQVSSGSSCVRLERLFLRPGLPPGGRSARRLSNVRQRHRSHAPTWRGATV